LDARAGAARACAAGYAVACGEVNQAQVWSSQIAGDVLCLVVDTPRLETLRLERRRPERRQPERRLPERRQPARRLTCKTMGCAAGSRRMICGSYSSISQAPIGALLQVRQTSEIIVGIHCSERGVPRDVHSLLILEGGSAGRAISEDALGQAGAIDIGGLLKISVFEPAPRSLTEPARLAFLWASNDGSGSVVGQMVENWIRDSEAIVADITYVNDNVTYEIGFGIGSQKNLRLIRNSSVDSQELRSIGLLDTLIHDNFKTKSDLEVFASGQSSTSK
jgi:hypothetical protein